MNATEETDALVRELRLQAAGGRSAVEMAAWLHGRLGPQATYFRFAGVLFQAFKIPVEKLHFVATWSGLGRGGALTDEELERLLDPLVPRSAPIGE
jgi:hypothetical protein